jgi:hypothetical protein
LKIKAVEASEEPGRARQPSALSAVIINLCPRRDVLGSGVVVSERRW